MHHHVPLAEQVRRLTPEVAGPAGPHYAYRDEYELVRRREAARRNDLWQADHTELDVMVLDGVGEATRPWMTAILDDHFPAAASNDQGKILSVMRDVFFDR